MSILSLKASVSLAGVGRGMAGQAGVGPGNSFPHCLCTGRATAVGKLSASLGGNPSWKVGAQSSKGTKVSFALL